MAEYTNFLSPVGRLVQGSPSKGYSGDGMGGTKTYKTGSREGEVRTDYFLGVAFEKASPDVAEFIKLIKDTAKAHVPQSVGIPGFAFKIVDGDSTVLDKKGNRPCDKVGFANCWVVQMSNDRPPTCYTASGVSVIPPEDIKTGYYIRVSGSLSGHGGQNPGIYINHQDVELVAHGDEISNRPTGSAVFGSTPAAHIPQAAKATPAAPPAPAPAPAAPTTYEVNGVDYTIEQLKASGWTDAQISGLDAPF